MLQLPLLQAFLTLLNPDPAHRGVCIVGGGFAGLAAAIELQKAGEDFVLLEATSRLGGRVYPFMESITGDGGVLQLGAEFINGKDNQVYRIAERLGLIDGREEDYGIYEGNVTYGIGGGWIEPDVIEEWKSFISPLEDEFYEEAEEDPASSVAERFQLKYDQFIATRQDRRHVFDALANLYRTYYESEWSASVEKLALANFVEWDDNSNENFAWKMKDGGFYDILKELMRHISMSNIRVNSIVTKVEWAESPVRVHLHSGDVITCEHVIMTAPLGHLKRNQDLFSPALPTKKREAIDYIGFGSLEKVFVEYEEPWWAENVTSLVTLRIDGVMDRRDDLADAMRTFQPVHGRSNTLLLWLSGKGPAAAASLTDAELADRVTVHLRQAFNEPTIPQPKNVVCHHWLNDPFTMGAYSYLTPDAVRHLSHAYEAMAEPVTICSNPRLCFAGEHTHSKLYQTASGAYESGMREARRLLEYRNSANDNR